MQKFSFHNHTTFSDGKNTVEEMLTQAVKLGWKEIGISDHLIIHERLKDSPSWQKWKLEAKIFWDSFDEVYDYFARNVEYIRKISDNYPLKVRVGAEVDFFTYNGWLEKFHALCEKLKLDFCISGNHFLFTDDNCSNIIDIENARHVPEEYCDNMVRRHLKTLSMAAETGLFDFMAHIDYMRKYDYFSKEKFSEDKNYMLDLLIKSGIAVELSTKGLRKGGDFYPESNMLKKLIASGVKMVISDDAHNINELGYRFDDAEDYLQRLNCVSRWSFTQK